MCELFGYDGKNRIELNEYLKLFYSHSMDHPHGWGIADMNDGIVNIEKEPVQATRSQYLKNRLSVPVCSNRLFSHIRYATIGNIDYCNCHPFQKRDSMGRDWVLMHNGTVFSYEKFDGYTQGLQGETDSEKILFYFVDRIEQEEDKCGRKLDSRERFDVLDEIVVDMSAGNKLNLMFSDGEMMYVHYNLRDTLHYRRDEDGILFSTYPLERQGWQKAPFMQLMAFSNGELKYTGTAHSNEYRENTENIQFLYRIFAGL